ncbi:MAG: hypothetical protein KC503_31565 [Myxococcales bacterium]|nr:hypothetical protein [Myxococcales bacterium]
MTRPTLHQVFSAGAAVMALVLLLTPACTGSVEQLDATPAGQEAGTGTSDGQPPPPPPREGGVINPGDPCPLGDCGGDATMLCFGGACRRICQGGCGDSAPECASDEGCYSVTSFSSACLPTSGGQIGDSCDGASCAPGGLCVEWGGAPPRCLQRCAGGGGCKQGYRCSDTNQGCAVCHP